MSSQRARTEYPIFMRKNRGRLPSSPPTASAASLDVSTGRSNFRTEIRHPAVPQIATGTNPIIALLPHPSKHQPLSTSLHIQGHHAKADTCCGSGVGARIGDAGLLSATIVWTCSVSPDTEQSLRPQSPEVGTLTPGATCNMARRECVPSLRAPGLHGFRIINHK